MNDDWTPLVVLLGQQAGAKLPPETRAAALLALVGIVLAGLFLIAGVLLGGSWVRRLGSHRRGPAVPKDRRPLLRPEKEAARDELPEASPREEHDE